jgi:hypothetical protein
MELNICERFPALSPFDVREKKASEVFLLIRRLNDYHAKEKNTQGKQKIRRRAGDDWF